MEKNPQSSPKKLSSWKEPRFLLLSVIAVLVLATIFTSVLENSFQVKPSYSEFTRELKEGKIKTIKMHTQDNSLEVQTRQGVLYQTAYPDNVEPELVKTINKQRVELSVIGKSNSWLGTLMIYLIAGVVFLAIFFFFISRAQGAGINQLNQFSRSRAKMAGEELEKITFKDVAGIDEVVEELKEIKEYLVDPSRFKKL
jgi:cell division protease FtsH